MSESDDLAQAYREVTQALYMALQALEGAAAHLSAKDVADSEGMLWESVEYRPLTQRVIVAATQVRAVLDEAAGVSPNVGVLRDLIT